MSSRKNIQRSTLRCLLIACLFITQTASGIKIEIPKELQAEAEARLAVEVAAKEAELKALQNTEPKQEVDSVELASDLPEEAPQPVVTKPTEMDSATVIAVEQPNVYAAADGMIVGQVVDQESTSPVSGVAIIIEGTDIGSITDGNGNYTLGPVPSGSYTVSFVKTGYIEAKVTEFEVAAGETKTFPFALPPRPAEMSDEVFELQDFVVTAAEASEMMLKLELIMNSNSVLSIMSSEDFSKYASSDIGDAVKRVSGVTVKGGKYASVRGLGDRYLSTSLNGLPIASPDPDRLAVQLDLFPTSLVSTLEVYKTYTPDKPGNATSGINIVVDPIPDAFFLNVSLSGGYNANAFRNSNFLKNDRSGKMDRWASGSNDRSLPDIAKGPFPDILGKTITTNQFLADRFPSKFILQSDYDNGIDTLDTMADSLGRSNHTFTGKPELNHGLKLGLGDVYELEDNKHFGYTLGINYSRKSEFIENADYFRSYIDPGTDAGLDSATFQSPVDAIGYHKALRSHSTITSVLSASGSLGYEVGDDHKLSFTWMDLNISEDENVRLDATSTRGNYGRYYQFPFRDLWDPSFGQFDYDTNNDGTPDEVGSTDYQLQESLHYTERGLRTIQAAGEHQIDLENLAYGDIKIEWAHNRDTSSQKEPGFLQTRGIIANENGQITLSTNSTSAASVEPSYLIWRSIGDKKCNYKGDVTFSDDLRQGFESKFKIGLLSSESNRTVLDEYLEMEYLNGDIPSSGDPDAPFANFDDLYPTAYLTAADVGLVSKSKGYYWMLDQKLFSNFSLIAGVRFEDNSADVTVNGEPQLRGAGLNNPFEGLPSTGGYDQSSTLPVFSLIWKGLDDKLTLRGSYSETIALPSAREVSPYASSTFAGADVEVGNLNLIPSGVVNYDIGFTYANEIGDSVTLNLFHKKVSNRIERIAGLGADTSSSSNYDDYDIFAFSQNVGASIYSWYNNPSEADLYGVEFEVRKDLSFTGVNGLSLGMNYTYIDGAVDRFPIEVASKLKAGLLEDPSDIEEYQSRQLTGQASDIFNGDITYENKDWGFRVSLIGYYVSEILSGTSLVNSYDVFDKAYTAYDITMSKEIGNGFKIGFTAKNITDSDRGTYYQSIDNTSGGLRYGSIDRDKYRVGTSYSASIGYDF